MYAQGLDPIIQQKKKEEEGLRSDYLLDHIKIYNQIFYICKPTKDLEL